MSVNGTETMLFWFSETNKIDFSLSEFSEAE